MSEWFELLGYVAKEVAIITSKNHVAVVMAGSLLITVAVIIILFWFILGRDFCTRCLKHVRIEKQGQQRRCSQCKTVFPRTSIW
ncbi:MAG: hypothetical protein HQ530_00085 [Parcubacteria group bacterium]|nr:hypothetical protein [Parcubacteria group bacterium]